MKMFFWAYVSTSSVSQKNSCTQRELVCTHRKLACTANILTVHEWILLKFDILLSENKSNTIRSVFGTISYVHARKES